jgi:N-acetyl-alpha-D-muramate 1-phosphate uridylyltransferase
MSKPDVRAMIFAAGMGTRLKPFTDGHPKALYVVDGKTLLEHSLLHLKRYGITRVIINVHHFAHQITDFLHQNIDFGMEIAISDETDRLLETGGGLKKAAWFFKDCDVIVARNVDILSGMDLGSMITAHLEKRSMATLAVRDRPTARYFLFNEQMQLRGWMNKNTGELKGVASADGLNALAFSGIQVLSPSIFPLIAEEGKFSLTDLYLRLSAHQKITAYPDDHTAWADAGRGGIK